jgi:hypothetical protein
MAMQAAFGEIQQARRNALVDYYIAYCVPDTPIDGEALLSTRVKTPDDLYEYLLIDTQITAAVTTSQVAEAISSVQLYINRCLGGYDPDVDNALGSTMVNESKPGGFLYDWDAYNQVYSTWAGKERLQYYPSVYLNPSLRYNKTELFNALEETINQGRINSTRVNAGFKQYMLGFETIANLETISGYQAGLVASEDCKDTLYFIGRTATEPYSYYWRSCNMAIRDDQGNITGGAWSQWLKIGAPATDALNGYLSPCWFQSRLYVSWLSRNEIGATGTDANKEPTYQYYVNLWCLREDGGWVVEGKYPCPTQGVPERAFSIVNTSGEDFSVYVATTAGYFAYMDSTWKKQDAPPPPIGMVLRNGSYKLEHDLNLQIVGSTVPVKSLSSSYYSVLIVSLNENTIILKPNAWGIVLQMYDSDGVHIIEKDLSASINNSVEYRSAVKFRFYTSRGSEGVGPPSIMSYIYFGAAEFHLNKKHLLLKDAYQNTTWSLPISTTSSSYFVKQLGSNTSNLLSYTTQTALIEQDNTQSIDFNGAYGLYFWEIFFHSSFLIADRYLNEQNYAEAAQWYRYIFAATGYRNDQGELETIDDLERYWNVVPLQQDHTWNKAIPPTDDPDVIAMNDPMHYKMAIFLNTVNLLIEQGDSAYRMLQRDYLAQAKMCYLQASQLLGSRPAIDYNASWPNPTVAAEAQEIVVLDSDAPDASAPTYLTQALRAFLAEQNGNFLPPYNADLLAYWDKLELRFYNLRHNLSLDGQPLSLPLYAEPVSPAELQRRHGAGDGAGGNSVNNAALVSQFRFVVLLEKARIAVNSVMQFGASLQGTLERRDNENMTLLLQTQQQQVLAMTQEIQNNNIAVLQDGLIALQNSLKGAQTRLAHYSNLYSNWISSSEQTAMDLRTAAAALNISAQPLHTAAAGLDMVPNIFGFACGGSKFGAAVTATAIGLQMGAMVNELSAQRLDISEQYRRRREDWQIQRDNAANEVAQLEAQIQSQTQQVAMAQKQLTLAKQELANQQALYDFHTTRFTGLALFNWMTGRLSSLYYQLYDVTLSLCLSCKTALVREIGPDRAGNLFVTPMWNDLYQGLLAGEGLLLELQRMENSYLKEDKRGLEILKTVSLNGQISKADSATSFEAMLNAVLASESPAAQGGVQMAMSGTDKLVITLHMNVLGLGAAYGTSGKTGRLKNISVTLPALLGPYQDVEATLAHSTGTYVALSRGLDDSGLFVVDFNDPKYLPFEGDPIDSGSLILTFFHAGQAGSQRALVESLVDVIYQIRYTLKDY